MTKTDALSRRKLLGRIGLLAAAGYTIPALTTLSMAQAGSGASGGGGGRSNDDGGGRSNDDDGGGAGRTLDNNTAAKKLACGPEDLNSTVYMQCLIDNGF